MKICSTEKETVDALPDAMEEYKKQYAVLRYCMLLSVQNKFRNNKDFIAKLRASLKTACIYYGVPYTPQAPIQVPAELQTAIANCLMTLAK
jgi:hypothetical protein